MITRPRIILGPAYHSLGSAPVVWRGIGDVKVNPTFEWLDVKDALRGVIDKIAKNRFVTVSHTPRYYDPTVTNPFFFPYINLNNTPVGYQIFGVTDTPYSVLGNNKDQISLIAAAVTKMPNFFLGVEKDFYTSELEITGVGGTGLDFSAANSIIGSTMTAGTYADPAVPGTSVLNQQKFTAAWGAFAGFTSFQGFKGFEFTHELSLKWHDDNGQYIGASIVSYRCMAKVIASGNTMAQMLSAMAFSGPGAAQGQRASSQSANLVVTGATGGYSATIPNAVIESGGFVFGNETLRQGEIAFVGTDAAGASPGLILT